MHDLLRTNHHETILQNILKVLKAGDGRERLAVVADILSIVGISGAAVVITLWALEWPSNPAVVFGPAVLALGALATLSIAFAVALFLAGTLQRCLANTRYLFVFGDFGLVYLCNFRLVYDLVRYRLMKGTHW